MNVTTSQAPELIELAAPIVALLREMQELVMADLVRRLANGSIRSGFAAGKEERLGGSLAVEVRALRALARETYGRW